MKPKTVFQILGVVSASTGIVLVLTALFLLGIGLIGPDQTVKGLALGGLATGIPGAVWLWIAVQSSIDNGTFWDARATNKYKDEP